MYTVRKILSMDNRCSAVDVQYLNFPRCRVFTEARVHRARGAGPGNRSVDSLIDVTGSVNVGLREHWTLWGTLFFLTAGRVLLEELCKWVKMARAREG